tara:strand:+ start:349 stop:1200 length:852 start_codon:yes stop_codon:yes gene_type:complete
MNNKGIFVLAIIFSMLTGCVAAPIERKTGELDLRYESERSSKTHPQTIAIVSPKLAAYESTQATSYNGMPIPQVTADFNQRFYQGRYPNTLETALGEGFQKLISDKGFRYVGPYRSFDEITYTDKKDTYLAIIPSLDLEFSKAATQPSCSGARCVEEGRFSISGDFSFKLVEPLTMQTFMTKRISLQDLDISKEYRAIFDNPSHNKNDLVGLALNTAFEQIEKASNQGQADNSKNIDTSEKALTEAVNEFYAAAMARLDTYLQSEEILSFSRDVEALKDRKRY